MMSIAMHNQSMSSDRLYAIYNGWQGDIRIANKNCFNLSFNESIQCRINVSIEMKKISKEKLQDCTYNTCNDSLT